MGGHSASCKLLGGETEFDIMVDAVDVVADRSFSHRADRSNPSSEFSDGNVKFEADEILRVVSKGSNSFKVLSLE
jgi:hypothetical protein